MITVLLKLSAPTAPTSGRRFTSAWLQKFTLSRYNKGKCTAAFVCKQDKKKKKTARKAEFINSTKHFQKKETR